MRYLMILLMAVVLVACGTAGELEPSPQDSQDPITKEKAAELLSKSDILFDPCERYGWYDDGICDDFCPNPDPDCDATPGAGCSSNADCHVGGCSGQLCGSIDDDLISTCEYLPEYACYDQEYTECGCFDGECGWKQTEEFEACLEEKGQENPTLPLDPNPTEPSPTEPDPAAECKEHSDCKVGGCSGQLCGAVDNDLISDCQYKPEYACYDQKYTECGCFDGECGWKQTEELETCLEENQEDPPQIGIDSCPAPRQSDMACIQVIAYATSPDGSQCCQYPTPCSAPEGWTVGYEPCR